MMKNAIDPQKNFKKWLEANKEKVAEFIKQNDVSVRDLDFDHRIVNILETNGLQFLSDILWKSAVELRKLDFVGRAESERIVLGCRFYLRNKMDEIVAFCKEESDETSESDPEEQILIRVSKPNEAMQLSSAKEISLTDTTLPEAKSENNIVLPDERYREIPIEVLELSTRSYNALRRGGFNTVGDLIGSYNKGFSHIQNLGKQSVEEIYEKLDAFLKEAYPASKIEKIEAREAKFPPLPESEYPFSFEEIMQNDILKMECVAFFEENADRFIFTQIPFSVRAKNALLNHRVRQLSELIKLYPDEILSIKNLGKKTLLELEAIARGAVEENIGAISFYIQQTNEWMKEKILQLIQSDSFRGYSFEQIKTAVPAVSDEGRIKKAIGALLEKGLIEYVDFRCYPVYPSFSEALELAKDQLTPREFRVLEGRMIEGKTLEEIGAELNIGRERARQVINKAFRNFKIMCSDCKTICHFDEDYYEYLFTHYLTEKEFWTDFLYLSENTYFFLHNAYKSGSLSLEEAEKDPKLDFSLKIKIQNYLDRGKIRINGELIKAARGDLEDYALKYLCQDEMTWSDFCAAYNKVLSDNGIPFDQNLFYTEENLNTRRNRVSESDFCLWKSGSRLRYYDIEAQDYSEFLDGIGFAQYTDTAISTLKWFREFPELMAKYDIRDQYELHNLLKKIISPETFPDVSFDRQPCITFGDFDREKAVFEIIKTFSPITAEELLEFLYSEYGFEQGTAWNCCKPFMQFYHQGVFRMEFKSIPTPRAELLKEKLAEEFYFISEIENIYCKMFPEAEYDEINPHSLKAIGLTVMSNYVLKNHDTAESFFEDLLTREDVYSIESIQRRFGSIQMYNQTYRRMRENNDIFLFENDQIITLNRLQKVGITKEDVLEFCESVLDFVDEEQMFTIHSLRREGFETKLDDLGFDDSFYNGILAMYPSFVYQRVFHGIVLMKGTCGMLSKKQFILSMLSKYDTIDMDEFMDDVEGDYGIRISDRYEVTSAIQGTDFYYSDTMNKIYSSKELYYAEMED